MTGITCLKDAVGHGSQGVIESLHQQESGSIPICQHRHRIALLPKPSHSPGAGSDTEKFPPSAALIAEHFAESADAIQ